MEQKFDPALKSQASADILAITVEVGLR